jgi:hypothetical protein
LVGDRLREDVISRNLGGEPVGVTLSLAVDTDFADLSAVKEGRVQLPHDLAVDIGTASMAFTLAGPDYTRSVQITAATGRRYRGVFGVWRAESLCAESGKHQVKQDHSK